MKSPFPGMDPYLEHRWQDIHQSLCTYARDALNEQLGKGLVARLGERLLVQADDQAPRTIYPDVRVVQERRPFRDEGDGGVAVAVLEVAEEVAAPVKVRLEHEPESQAFIEITEIDNGRLITTVEFISASNKRTSAGRKLYKKKQKELYRAGVNLVEIDLLGGGPHVFLTHIAAFTHEPRTRYFATISRAAAPDILEGYPISIRKPLPSLRIPLRPSDKEVVLRLQPLFEQAYRNGRYGETNYTEECDPPLNAADETWAAELLKAAGRL